MTNFLEDRLEISLAICGGYVGKLKLTGGWKKITSKHNLNTRWETFGTKRMIFFCLLKTRTTFYNDLSDTSLIV